MKWISDQVEFISLFLRPNNDLISDESSHYSDHKAKTPENQVHLLSTYIRFNDKTTCVHGFLRKEIIITKMTCYISITYQRLLISVYDEQFICCLLYV